ncbi:type IV inositol polyphosphate 5-phosphatase 11 [Selaginella moellendorffii]|uniref:type IV inositol polyphosphate 5-phosphatase 11 n=1 Tax=Selaginella moellendorffii TaxID=88036 RepID=UPI000D1CECC4|nr:type IV inositol polyphosphate 5-phosphatase 11 [Selaginella moellendorffii]|eukprot:XP_024515646.1 type IV inositol polyphosphate 5-phosphatase 11 [Selaginella moellendorffii]
MVWMRDAADAAAMGNCCVCSDSCDGFGPCPKRFRPRLMDFLRMEDREVLGLLLDRHSQRRRPRRQEQLDFASDREKIDGRSQLEHIFHQNMPVSENREGEASGALRIYVVTWNMNGKIPERNLANLVDDESARRKHDLYVIGLQEAPSFYVESFFLEILGESYCLVASSVMSSLQLFVFARTALLSFLTDPRSDKVSVGGFGGVIGRQKGAVAVSLRYRQLRFLFLSCHLAPHEGNVGARNAQFARITQSVFARPNTANGCSCLHTATAVVVDEYGLDQPQDQHKQNQHQACTNNTVEGSDLVILMGDLNYRVVGHKTSVGILIKNNLEKLLWPRDQLSREVARGNIFNGFVEGPLTFRPTYKYDVGTDNYDTSSKERVPSWTDRILFKVRHKSWLSVAVQDYDSINSLKSSDHRPVKALLRVNTNL